MGYDLHKIGFVRPDVLRQTYARNIIINFYLRTKFQKFEAFQEGTANHKQTCEKVADVTFVNIQTGKVCVSVEIAKSWDKLTIHRIEFSFIKSYKHQEVFLFNYKKNQWRKYCKIGKEFVSENSSFSKVLEINLAEMITLEN